MRGAYAMLLVVLLLGGSACRGAFIGRAQVDYDEGRYLEVAETLARREPTLHKFPRAKQALYGLYRGLALLKLGDYEGAGAWLSFTDDIQRVGPTLDPRRTRMLQQGQAELEAMLRYRQQGLPPQPPPEPGPPEPAPPPDTSAPDPTDPGA